MHSHGSPNAICSLHGQKIPLTGKCLIDAKLHSHLLFKPILKNAWTDYRFGPVCPLVSSRGSHFSLAVGPENPSLSRRSTSCECNGVPDFYLLRYLGPKYI